MMSSLSYTIMSIIYLLILIGLYAFKKKIKSNENKIYSIILVITLFSLMLEFSSFFLIKNEMVVQDVKYIFYIFNNDILYKIYNIRTIILFSWFILIYLYIPMAFT